MDEDPIVEELHRIREEMLVQYGGLDGLVKHLHEIEAEMQERVVALEPRPPVQTLRKIR